MGGRGSLSSNGHTITDSKSFARELHKSGVRLLVGKSSSINNKNLSMLRDIGEEIIRLNKKHGFDGNSPNRPIKHLVLGSKKDKDMFFSSKYVVGSLKSGKKKVFENALVISHNTLKKSNRDMQKHITKGHRRGKSVARNLKETVTRHYGKALYNHLSKYNPKAHSELTRQLTRRMDSGQRITIGRYKNKDYAKNKELNKYKYSKAVSEAYVFLDRKRRPRNNVDLIDTVGNVFSKYYKY